MGSSVLWITVISARNVDILSLRISGGIYLSINGYLTTTKPLSRDRTVVWDEIVKLTNVSCTLRIQLITALEFGTMLGRGELIGEVETSEEFLLSHGDETFEIYFPAIRRRGYKIQPVPVLKLKVFSRVRTGAKIYRALLKSISECDSGRAIPQDTHVETVMPDIITDCAPLDFIDECESERVIVQDIHVETVPTEFNPDCPPLDFMDEYEAERTIMQAIHVETVPTEFYMDCPPLDFMDEYEAERTIMQATHVETAITDTNTDCPPLDFMDEYEAERTIMQAIHAETVMADTDTDCPPLDFISEFESERTIAENTDDGHAQFAEYMASRDIFHLKKALDYFKWVLKKCPKGHGDRAAALANLAWARLTGFLHENPEYIDNIILLFREALELRPLGTPDHALSIYHLAYALSQLSLHGSDDANIRESATLYCTLLSICPEGTAFRSDVLEGQSLDDVIRICNDLPGCESFEDLLLRRTVTALCHPHNQYRPIAFEMLARTLCERGSIQEIEESIVLRRTVLDYRPMGHPQRYESLNSLVSSLRCRYALKRISDDLNESIALSEESLRLCPSGHKHIVVILNNLGSSLIHRYIRERKIEDIDRAIEVLNAVLPLNAEGSANFLHFAFGLIVRYVTRGNFMDLMEAMNSCHQAFRLQRPEDSPAAIFDTIASFFVSVSQRIKDIEESLISRGSPGQDLASQE